MALLQTLNPVPTEAGPKANRNARKIAKSSAELIALPILPAPRANHDLAARFDGLADPGKVIGTLAQVPQSQAFTRKAQPTERDIPENVDAALLASPVQVTHDLAQAFQTAEQKNQFGIQARAEGEDRDILHTWINKNNRRHIDRANRHC